MWVGAVYPSTQPLIAADLPRDNTGEKKTCQVNQASKEFCQLSGRRSQPSEGSHSFFLIYGTSRTRGSPEVRPAPVTRA